MSNSSCKASVVLIILALVLVFGQGAYSGELEAAPWKHIAGINEQPLPGNDGDDVYWNMTPGNLEELAKLAEEGNALAAAMLGGYYRQVHKNPSQAVRGLRLAVKNGDVDSAFALGELYFPVGGSLGREKFSYRPDVVLGYAWHAIALSGIAAMEGIGKESRTEKSYVQIVVDRLRMLLLPSERARVAALLSDWPEALPPDTPLETMPGKSEDAHSKAGKHFDSPPDADAVVEILRQWTTHKMKNMAKVEAIFKAPPDLLRTAYEKMQTLAEDGDAEAEYMVAWCRLYGLGTGADEAAAMPVIMTKIEAGDADAMFLLSMWFMKRGDEERALDFAVRAAEKGHGRAMMLLSQIWRDKDENDKAAPWMEKAAEAGEQSAIEEMIRVAESGGDARKIVFWLTVNLLRTPDPAVAYRCRMLIAYVGNKENEETLQRAMEAGERWHSEHPSPE